MELVITIGIILTLTFAIIDFSVFLRDFTATSNAVRDAARKASALPRFGTVDGHRVPFSSETSFAAEAVKVLSTTGSAIPTTSIDEMWVYNANDQGFPIGTSDFSNCPAGNCVRYRWFDNDPDDDTPGFFQWISGTWDPESINACPGDDAAMSVGVFMRVNHVPAIGIFGTAGPIEDHVVNRFEPLRLGEGNCKPFPP